MEFAGGYEVGWIFVSKRLAYAYIEIGIKARHLELICSGGERRMKLDDQKRIIGGSLVRVP